MAALGLYGGTNTPDEHAGEAARLGGDGPYRMRASSSCARRTRSCSSPTRRSSSSSARTASVSARASAVAALSSVICSAAVARCWRVSVSRSVSWCVRSRSAPNWVSASSRRACCLATTEAQFRLSIPSSHTAYDDLLNEFERDLRAQSPKAWADLETDDPTATVPVPFWSWTARQDRVMQILHPCASDDDFKFTWPLIDDVLDLCTVTVTSTSTSTQTSPPCPPIAMIPAFATARRRVYLTAALSDDSILVTDFNASPEDIAQPVTPGSTADLGDRMILAPIALNPSLYPKAVRVPARQYADGDRDGDGTPDAKPVNVVVLVPSNRAAAPWRSHAAHVWRAGELQDGVAALKDGHVELVVLVNKYDGIDLPKEACELLILDGVPRPMDATECREAAVLSGSSTILARQLQRIEQGMGRGVRDSEDHCAVLLLGAHQSIALHDPKQYDTTGLVRQEAVALRQAFDLAATGRRSDAADRLKKVIPTITDPAVHGWLTEQRAAYFHHVDAAAAQQRPAAAQAQAAAEFLASKYTDGTTLVLAIKALIEDVVWGDEDRTEDAERAWQRLGQHLGLDSTRPEK
ncbi:MULTISPECIES: DUF6245 family protein [Streptosporangium]|uniref:ATP-dependent helicase C-terminal domain-containing protein n=1 Tax=Streptosporangium brasiliense TaxID=47480 RepID=A0ABT9RHQ6_9ACTN|nr:hypothetical protein [Streptosporangium brasiliense]MDP9868816.1 hypothetical protein [Streptosporangium brasiliense]